MHQAVPEAHLVGQAARVIVPPVAVVAVLGQGGRQVAGVAVDCMRTQGVCMVWQEDVGDAQEADKKRCICSQEHMATLGLAPGGCEKQLGANMLISTGIAQRLRSLVYPKSLECTGIKIKPCITLMSLRHYQGTWVCEGLACQAEKGQRPICE